MQRILCWDLNIILAAYKWTEDIVVAMNNVMKFDMSQYVISKLLTYTLFGKTEIPLEKL